MEAQGGRLTVDRAAQAFVVRVPRALLPVGGRWRVRVAAGLADAARRDGMTDALVVLFQETAAGTPPFGTWGADGGGRLVTGNSWSDDHQSDELFAGDVSAFSRVVDWSRLAGGASSPEPRPRGYSLRCYVTGLRLGHGVAEDEAPAGDLRPNLLGAVQPYSVYVPPDVPAGRSTP